MRFQASRVHHGLFPYANLAAQCARWPPGRLGGANRIELKMILVHKDRKAMDASVLLRHSAASLDLFQEYKQQNQ